MSDNTNEFIIETFSFDTIKNFDEHILSSIRCYSSIIESVKSFAKYFIQDKTNVYDIGCSTGKLLKELETDKNIVKIGIDKCNNLLPNNTDDVSFINIDLTDDFIFNNASLILSLFTMQFISLNKREKIIKNIYNGLNRGGGFIFCEKIYAENSKIQDIFTFNYYDFKANNFNYEQIMSKEKDLRSIMFPLSHKDNIELLENAGFKNYDIFIKHFNFEGILAIK